MKHLSTRFTEIIGWLRQAVAAYAAREACGPSYVQIGTQTYVEVPEPPRHRPIGPATWNLLTDRLARLAQRFRALRARVEAGPLPPPRPPRIRPQSIGATPARAPSPRLPAARGWINARVPAAAPSAGTLITLLQDPAMPELVARAPQAGRLLRPLCRALAVDLPDWLRRAPIPRPSPTVIRNDVQDPPLRRAQPKPDRPGLPHARPVLPLWRPAPFQKRKNDT